ncbi:unnamed protein product [Ceratitis capitata]|uniref:(Mediterranean fruit fly) hypothetical protein n=1 Tax=Ceratitis capitata TaxID=7213 RepID=A0A811U654_CERCA|nr:unnamed protein product [Ceratitis capitata]
MFTQLLASLSITTSTTTSTTTVTTTATTCVPSMIAATNVECQRLFKSTYTHSYKDMFITNAAPNLNVVRPAFTTGSVYEYRLLSNPQQELLGNFNNNYFHELQDFLAGVTC